MRNQQNVKVRVNSSFETICPFPIGYVYMSSNSTSPGSIYGGTWASISGGRYMRAAGAWGNGGSNTIGVNQIPAHTHYPSRRAFVYTNSYGTNNLPAAGSVLASYGYLVDNNHASGITPSQPTGGGKQCRLSSVPTTALFGTELRRFFGGDVNGIY